MILIDNVANYTNCRDTLDVQASCVENLDGLDAYIHVLYRIHTSRTSSIAFKDVPPPTLRPISPHPICQHHHPIYNPNPPPLALLSLFLLSTKSFNPPPPPPAAPPPPRLCAAQAMHNRRGQFLVLTVIMCATSTFGMFGGFETKKEKEIRLYLADVAVCKVECGKLAFFEPGKPCGCDASASSEEIGCCRDDYWYEYSAGYKTKITFGDRWSRRHVDELSSCLHKWGVQNETCNRMFPISDKHICNFEVNTAEFEAKFTSSTCSEGRHARGIGQSNPPLGTKNLLEDTDVRRSPLARGTTQSTSDLSVR